MSATQLTFWPEARPLERLRWSISRDKRLRDCARKYYLYHYASAGGARPDATPAVRDIYVLKHLRNRHMWVGEVVHELIELVLTAWRRGESVSAEAVIGRGIRRMRANYAQSVQGLYRERPAQAFGLLEHEYGEPLTRGDWQGLRGKMERCMQHFFALPLTEIIRQTPTWRWLALEALGSFELDGATVVVKPDFAWRDENGRVMLLDWKTGVPHADEYAQLAVYGIFAQRVWGLGDAAMHAQLVYLDDGHSQSFEMGPAQLAAAEVELRMSLAEMRRFGAGNTALKAEHFPLTEALQVCARCSFRRICGRA